MGYKTVIEKYEREIVIKKSRFIGRLYPVADEYEIKELIQRIKKEHHQANHHCTAFRIHGQQLIERYSDDGEPSGTAGMPMLEVLRGAGLENVLAVSIRYFGGTKLGTGGLVRAYTESVQDVIGAAEIIQIGSFVEMKVQVTYELSGKVAYYIEQNELLLDDTIYSENVEYLLYVDVSMVEAMRVAFSELTNGGAALKTSEPMDGYIKSGRFLPGGHSDES